MLLLDKDGAKYAVVKWYVQDIMDVAEDLDVVLTESEAEEILLTLVSHHDANYGINWDVIEVYINDHIERKNCEGVLDHE